MARILVVDDDSNARKTLDILLRAAGHDVLLEVSGRGGIRAVRDLLPDLVILDVMLPDMDGLAVLEELRSARGTRHVPVIMLTGLESDEARRKSLGMYAEAHLSKPVGEASLLATVSQVLKFTARTEGRAGVKPKEEA